MVPLRLCAHCSTTESKSWHCAPKAWASTLDRYPKESRFCYKCYTKAYNDARRADPHWNEEFKRKRREKWGELEPAQKKARASRKLKGGQYYETIQKYKKKRREMGLDNTPAARARRARWERTHPEQHKKIIKTRAATREHQYAQLFRVSKRRSSDSRTLKVTLTFEEFCAKRCLPCGYCGKDLGPTGSQMDRKDNNNPEYSVANSVPCCTVCNAVKRDYLSYEDMKAFRTLEVDANSPRAPLAPVGVGKTRPLTLRKRYGRLVKRMRSLGEECALSFEDYQRIAGPGVSCHYCTGPLSPTGYNLDRRDNNLSYTADNVVPCCPVCNATKGEYLTEEEMLDLVRKVTKSRESKP